MARPGKSDSHSDYARWPTAESRGIDAGYEKARPRAEQELKETMAGPGNAHGGKSQKPTGKPESRKR